MRTGAPEINVVTAMAAANSSTWRIALVAVAVAVACPLVFHAATAWAMYSIWMRSDTFAHCLVVPPLALWLVWRARKRVMLITPRPGWLWLVPLSAAGVAWALGEFGNVNALSQFALVAMVVFCVPAVLGTPVAREIAFPLAFLFFAVPIGEFMLPQLMSWTADVTVLALRATGLPVYREGQNFSIPSGNWSVVEACSGVRYLMASVMAGTLYAYLNYRSLKRRLTFVAVSFVVPIVANWIRAYLIVLLGHYSSGKIAAGVDHVVYGWLFFGVVMVLLYWIGARWREDEVQHPNVVVSLPGPKMSSSIRLFTVALAAVAAVTGVWSFGSPAPAAFTVIAPERLPHVRAPAGWQTTEGAARYWRPTFSGASAEVRQVFERSGNTVAMYIAYYRDQSQERKLVSSTNSLVSSTDPVWSIGGSSTRDAQLGSITSMVRTTKLSSVSGERVTVWQWYWINGRVTSSDVRAKAYTAWSRLLGRGDDSAVVILYTLDAQRAESDAVLAAFAADAWPGIDTALNEIKKTR